jgi:hypothetical protein
MYRKTIIAGLALIAIPALSTAAFGEDVPLNDAMHPIDAVVEIVPEADAVVIAVDQVVADHPAATVATPEADNVLSDDTLVEQRGGQAIVIGNQTLTAVSTGSVLNGNYSAGSVALTDNALSNFNGLGNLLINTGAQNNLQSAMNVTINFGQ